MLSTDLTLQGRGTGDDLDQLGGDTRLTGSVVLQCELADHLGGVLGSVLHGSHSRGLLRGGVLHEGVVDVCGEGELVQVEEDLGVFAGNHGGAHQRLGAVVQ